MAVAVGLTVSVAVGIDVLVGIGVSVTVLVGDGVEVSVTVLVGDDVGVDLAVGICVGVSVDVGMILLVAVKMLVGVKNTSTTPVQEVRSVPSSTITIQMIVMLICSWGDLLLSASMQEWFDQDSANLCNNYKQSKVERWGGDEC